MHLADYKVRILTPEAGTAAVTRVIIESADDDGRRWSTVGVSTNVIDASYDALHDAHHLQAVRRRRRRGAVNDRQPAAAAPDPPAPVVDPGAARSSARTSAPRRGRCSISA